ncbi:hypothetical protein KC678_05150, partial [Candidatus Dojkabacteria bacterium]|nr:hypothetical protein [Candidatus Dojkabacteria bacterium]
MPSIQKRFHPSEKNYEELLELKDKIINFLEMSELIVGDMLKRFIINFDEWFSDFIYMTSLYSQTYENYFNFLKNNSARMIVKKG